MFKFVMRVTDPTRVINMDNVDVQITAEDLPQAIPIVARALNLPEHNLKYITLLSVEQA